MLRYFSVFIIILLTISYDILCPSNDNVPKQIRTLVVQNQENGNFIDGTKNHLPNA